MVVIRTPSSAPVHKPNEVDEPGCQKHVKQSAFLALNKFEKYIRMLVVPQKEGKGKEGQIVVRSLEASETGDGDDGQKEFLDVLDH